MPENILRSLQKMKTARTMATFLMFAVSSNCFDGCQRGVNDLAAPDTIDAAFVWRICNESTEYAMEDIKIMEDSLVIGTLAPGNCSKYYPGLQQGKVPINQIKYEQSGKEYFFIYLEARTADRGLKDSTLIRESPGRYTYHFKYDSSKFFTEWIEIEREGYH